MAVIPGIEGLMKINELKVKSKNETEKYYVPGTHFVKIETHNDSLLEKLNNVPYGYELASSSYVITSVSSSGHAHGIYVLFFC